MTEQLPVYVFTIEDKDGVVLTRPTTSRSTVMMAMTAVLAHVQPKAELPWKVCIAQGTMTDAEIKAHIEAFAEQFEKMMHGELDCDATDLLNDVQVFLAGEAMHEETQDSEDQTN